eukprot:gene23311-24715_t
MMVLRSCGDMALHPEISEIVRPQPRHSSPFSRQMPMQGVSIAFGRTVVMGTSTQDVSLANRYDGLKAGCNVACADSIRCRMTDMKIYGCIRIRYNQNGARASFLYRATGDMDVMPCCASLVDNALFLLCDPRIWVALLVALASPILTVGVNHSVRIRRIKLLESFTLNFMPRKTDDTARPGVHDIRQSPSLEFAVSKYLVGLDEVLTRRGRPKDTGQPPAQPNVAPPANQYARLNLILTRGADVANAGEAEQILNGVRCWSLRSNREIIRFSIFYCLIVFFG